MTETMQVFFFILGILLAVVNAGFILIYFVGEFNHTQLLKRTQICSERESALEKIGEEIERDAHWFSESPEVFMALQIIGRQIQRDHYFSGALVWRTWRAAMREQNDDES